MKKPIHIAILFLFTVSTFLFAIPSSGYACSCVPQAPVQEALNQAEAVFAGKVIKIVQPKPDAQGVISTADPVQITFEVSQSWKGVSFKEVTIRTALDSASCGFFFEADKEYIVYSYKNGDNVLETNICTRTAELTTATEDLATLGKGMTPTQEAPNPTETENPANPVNNGLLASPYVWATGILVLAGVTYFIMKKG